MPDITVQALIFENTIIAFKTICLNYYYSIVPQNCSAKFFKHHENIFLMKIITYIYFHNSLEKGYEKQ